MRWLCVFLIACGSTPPTPANPSPAPAPREIVIRREAATLPLVVEPGWTSTVSYKHDGEKLVFTFDALGTDPNFRYPEVMIDAKQDGGLVWGEDDWWFHASFRDCWSSGKYNDYKSCVNEAPSWSANNYTDQTKAPASIEIAIPVATIGSPKAIGIALDLTDTQTKYAMWPAGAQLAVPATWGTARIE